ncbi:hypothetical protein EGR_03090 [Echinococcus granulosus]|uniref:Uncharacterized protein n=1 Tax=Echinococcus granulosus TaxID=6210 RepID=W6V6N9_ECHGR|nr:hypothetical protein EGR_03090 [Echinococcus granulosus]EUB62069.1 hypothetical protein EGR_03090 [Echinococcus granulosus]
MSPVLGRLIEHLRTRSGFSLEFKIPLCYGGQWVDRSLSDRNFVLPVLPKDFSSVLANLAGSCLNQVNVAKLHFSDGKHVIYTSLLKSLCLKKWICDLVITKCRILLFKAILSFIALYFEVFIKTKVNLTDLTNFNVYKCTPNKWDEMIIVEGDF